MALALSFLLPGMAADTFPGDVVELVDGRGERLPRLEASGAAYFNQGLIVVDDTGIASRLRRVPLEGLLKELGT